MFSIQKEFEIIGGDTKVGN